MPEVLVIKPSSFGDIVHGLQVAETIRQRVPAARISWVAATAFAPLVRVCDTVDEVFEFRRRGGMRSFWKLIGELRRQRFDYVLDMQGLARSAVIARLARGAVKVGRRDGREGARLFCPQVVAPPPGGFPAHAIEVLLQFVSVFGIEPTLEGRLSFSRAPRLPASDLMPPHSAETCTLVVFPESRRPEKNWPGFAALVDRLLREHPEVRVIWSGRPPVDPGLDFPQDRFVNAHERIALDELPSVLARADWVISNDSGPMHLAAAMDVRALGVFGPTDPVRFGPWPPSGGRHRVVRAPGGDLRKLSVGPVAETLVAAGLCDETRSTRARSRV